MLMYLLYTPEKIIIQWTDLLGESITFPNKNYCRNFASEENMYVIHLVSSIKQNILHPVQMDR